MRGSSEPISKRWPTACRSLAGLNHATGETTEAGVVVSHFRLDERHCGIELHVLNRILSCRSEPLHLAVNER